MKRRVMLHGPSSLSISLPSKWVKKHKINKGDELEIKEDEEKLVILPENIEKESKETAVSLTHDTISFVRSVISNSYKKGFDTIRIKYEEKKYIPMIQEVVDGLIGLELIEQGDGFATAGIVSEESEEQLNNLWRRSFLLVKQLSEIVLKDVEQAKYDNYKEALQIKTTITRITDFCKRTLGRFMKHKEDTIFMYLIIWSLEKITNEYKYVYTYLYKTKPRKFENTTHDFLLRTNRLVDTYYEAFYKKDIRLLESIAKEKDKMLFEDLQILLSKSTKQDSFVLHHCANIVRRIWDMTGPLIAVITE